jgi:hypothetical protein
MEYGAVFTTDSQGFFKRSLIEACTTSPQEPVTLPSGEVWFEASLKGDPNKTYVFGVDPASEVDNFSIVVLVELTLRQKLTTLVLLLWKLIPITEGLCIAGLQLESRTKNY